MKLIGKGGEVIIDGVKKANITQYSMEETDGVILNQTMTNVSFTAILETASDIIRAHTEVEIVLKAGEPATITSTLNNCMIESVSIPVERGNAVTQQVSAVCHTTASIA